MRLSDISIPGVDAQKLRKLMLDLDALLSKQLYTAREVDAKVQAAVDPLIRRIEILEREGPKALKQIYVANWTQVVLQGITVTTIVAHCPPPPAGSVITKLRMGLDGLTTNNSSNYWSPRLTWADGAGAQQEVTGSTMTTAALAAGEWRVFENNLNWRVPAEADTIMLNITKVGSPGPLYWNGPDLYYRRPDDGQR